MKVSIYTFFFRSNSKYYIYNTLSNALLSIGENIYIDLQHARETGHTLEENSIDPDLWGILKNKYFITENQKDDFLLYKSMILPIRGQKNFMHLTLAATMECNFRCFYCFEKEKPKGRMSEDTMDAIVKHIESIPELQKIYLTWFGGEPLIAIDQMEIFYDKLMSKFNKEFSSNIITTGYFLSESVIPILRKINIQSVQITLDGNKERHNKIKSTPDNKDVFSRVLTNVDLLTDTAPEINVVFRINVPHDNMAEYASLFNLLANRYQNKNVTISPGIVQDRNRRTFKNPHFLNRKETSEFILDLWHTHKIYTPWLRYPNNNCTECAIRDQRAVSFDPEGYAYKCWEMIGQKRFAIGKLSKTGKIIDINQTLLNRQLYGADPFEDAQCTTCAYLPICEGGCPIQRIQNEFDNDNNDVCSIYKDYLEDFLKIHIALKDAGYENH